MSRSRALEPALRVRLACRTRASQPIGGRMNTLKTLGVALMLCFSLLLSGVACVLIAMSMKQQQPIGDADVVVAGFGNADNQISVSSHRRLIKEVMARRVAPPVTKPEHQTTVRALILP